MALDAGKTPRSASGTQRDRVIMQIGAAHNRVVTRRELLEAGVGRRAIAHRLACGRLYARHPGVYLLDPPETASRLTLLTAALASCGEGAMLSHRSAAELWGLVDEQAADRPIDVTVVGRHAGERTDNVRVHRVGALDPIDVRTHRGLALTSVVRTVLDLASRSPLSEVEQAVAVAERRRLATTGLFRAALDRYPARRGARGLRGVLAHGAAMTRSDGERRLLTLLRQAGLPKPLVNARALGYELDFLWPAAKVVVELDGYEFHSDRAAFERDRRRDATLAAAGYRVLRFTGRQLSDEPMMVVAMIAQALGGAGG